VRVSKYSYLARQPSATPALFSTKRTLAEA
jgi:hypothetical protein